MISIGWLESDCCRNLALPAKSVRIVSGMRRFSAVWLTRLIASPWLMPGLRLKLILAAGNWLRCRTASGEVSRWSLVTLPIGICAPLVPGT